MQCALYDADRCRSCQWLEKPYSQQLSDKQSRLKSLLAQQPEAQWLPPVTSAQQAFRNKAKMVVSGSVERPVLGMVQRDGSAVDLCACPLYPDSFAPVFAALKPFIARAGLTPYNVARRRGELKFLLLTESTQGGMMLRFVLRSREKLDQLRAALPWLQQQLPQLKVISANIQPVHMAILEGDEEIALTPSQSLAENFNQVPLWIRPQSFFQTNPQVAAALYAAARDWVGELRIGSMWDLFCGVGGFGLHCATPQMQLTDRKS
ncbi:MAG TPA: 23S rRNA (uracil(747)-C(5))-methyltransferase RlmC, partial [Pantoea sp.]|nr:23S rRNA (uracil(747)-C(5))-methyltransferase RlmC [Pantoea sp.]